MNDEKDILKKAYFFIKKFSENFFPVCDYLVRANMNNVEKSGH